MIPKNSVIYQIVIDRFNNDKNNLYEQINSPDYNSRFGNFLGGTFKGITKKVDYIEDLGASHIMISPVQKSSSYHCYNWEDSFRVNKRFGSEKDLKQMIEEYHKRNIGVIMDYVSTHVSSTHPLFLKNCLNGNEKAKELFIFTEQMKGNPKYRPYFDEMVYNLTDGKITNLDEKNQTPYLGYFGLAESPLLNLENPKVIEYHKKVLRHWIEKFGFDHVRFDSGFIQPRGFIGKMQEYLSSIKDIDILAEYWDFKISSGEGYGFSGGDCRGYSKGEFDIRTTLEFNFRSKNPEFFQKIIDNYFHFRDSLENHNLVLSISNHDLPRFAEGKNIQKILAALQFTLPSIPLIYYGEEIGMNQYNDGNDRIAQSRDPMRFDLFDEEMFSYYRNLAEFRRKDTIGNLEISELQINDNGTLLTYKVTSKDKNFFVFLNKEARDKPVNCSHLFHNPNLVPWDILSQRYLYNNQENNLLVKGESACILEERRRTSSNSDIKQQLSLEL
ncbi:Alpha-amylase MalA [uncultured archaeon]|nr:Alpha-amylase MalA [uncultured archaeon]